jgi:hypothetical protein
MTRSHRAAHRLIWLVLAVSVSLGFILALTHRPPPEPPPEPPPAADRSKP